MSNTMLCQALKGELSSIILHLGHVALILFLLSNAWKSCARWSKDMFFISSINWAVTLEPVAGWPEYFIFNLF